MSFNKLFDEILDKLPSELDSAWVKFVRSKYKKLWNAAQKEEREECAKIADKYFRHMVSRAIAEEIRDREA